MKVAHYIGRHEGDTLAVRLGWAAMRAVQRGEFRRVTHVESILEEHSDGSVTIASSSLRDGGVRSKRVHLAPGAWLVVSVPLWSAAAAHELLQATEGMPYDLLGAVATVLPTRQSHGRYFCTEWVGAPFLRSPHTFGPAHLAAITMSIGHNVTRAFFAERGHT